MIKVLVYHKITDPVNFEKQLIYLKKHYSLIGINNFIQAIGNTSNNRKPPLMITFDDGDVSVYRNAFPLLKKYRIPAVIFVVTKLINSEEPFWWDSIEYYSDTKDSDSLIWKVKEWPNHERLAFIERLKENSGKEKFRYVQLTYDQLVEMNAAGIAIANHSHTHALLNRCTPAEIRTEMETSMSILKKWDFAYNVFAYPNGNFSLCTEEIIKNAGIKNAFLFDHKINKYFNNPLKISRLIVDDTTPLWKFIFILSGWHSRILPVKKKIMSQLKTF